MSIVKIFSKNIEAVPPGSVVTEVEDFSKIINQRRVWGQTEGAVYAAHPEQSSGIFTMIDKKSDDRGTLVWEEKARILFERHPGCTPWAIMKRWCGQYKAPFGDLVLTSIHVNGNRAVITDAFVDRNHRGQKNIVAILKRTLRVVVELLWLLAIFLTIINMPAFFFGANIPRWFFSAPVWIVGIACAVQGICLLVMAYIFWHKQTKHKYVFILFGLMSSLAAFLVWMFTF